MIVPALLLRQAALAAALAAGDPAAETFHDTVVVVAERGPEILSDVPAAVTVLRREDVALRPAQTLAEWVDGLPGFQMLYAADFGGTPILSSRGFFGGGEAEYVQLRVDGVPFYDPESGLADWRRLRTESIAGLEALHGAASPLYGDTALAGVIDVRTRQASSEDAHAAASLGSFATAAFDGAVGWNRGARWRLGANASRTDGFRALTSEQARRLSIDRAPREIPDVTLTDQFGRQFTLTELRGAPVAVEFIYTSCPDACPLLSAGMHRIDAEGRSSPESALGRLRLVSISFDQRRDSVQRLFDYAQHFGADGNSWRLARVRDEHDLANLLRAFDIVVINDERGGFQHNAAVHLLNADGRLAHVLDADATPAVVASMIGPWR